MNACKESKTECSTKNHSLTSAVGGVKTTYYIELLPDAHLTNIFGVMSYLMNTNRFDNKNFGYKFDSKSLRIGNCEYNFFNLTLPDYTPTVIQ